MKRVSDLSDDELAKLAHRAAALPDAPESLVKTAIGLFHAVSAPSIVDVARQSMNRVLAALTFDSWAPSPALAVRSSPSQTRQMLFSAAGRDIDVRIAPSANAFRVSGQVFGPDRDGVLEMRTTSTADAGAPNARAAALDDLGAFELDAVPAGTYTLMLRVADAAIELPPIDVDTRD